ncbi:MAG: F-type H+-transporting ATPase subunit b [Patescibacteria group bacterium]|nr:F0F1 ATP synthase subunit B [Candidatus Saccharibacteria bacterium]MDQ5963082.1 F-type H+-transporting ATPase subunit b [Patescibacteria group bacterium]
MTISGLQNLTTFAAEASHGAAAKTAEKASALDTLGIDVKQLLFHLIAFSILVWILSKYVFPVLIRAIDERQSAIEESLSAAKNAEKNAADAEAKIDMLMRDARKEAGEIVATAKDEAVSLASQHEQRAKKQAERIVEEARESIGKEILAAKKALHNETIELVAQATEKVVGAVVTGGVDKKIIADLVSTTGASAKAEAKDAN